MTSGHLIVKFKMIFTDDPSLPRLVVRKRHSRKKKMHYIATIRSKFKKSVYLLSGVNLSFCGHPERL